MGSISLPAGTRSSAQPNPGPRGGSQTPIHKPRPALRDSRNPVTSRRRPSGSRQQPSTSPSVPREAGCEDLPPIRHRSLPPPTVAGPASVGGAAGSSSPQPASSAAMIATATPGAPQRRASPRLMATTSLMRRSDPLPAALERQAQQGTGSQSRPLDRLGVPQEDALRLAYRGAARTVTRVRGESSASRRRRCPSWR